MNNRTKFIYLILRRRRRDRAIKRCHEHWIHPFTALRPMKGFFYIKYQELRKYSKKFFGYYRMTTKSFDNLLRLVGRAITYQDTNWRKAISAEERLSITLRYLASGNSYYSLYYEYLIGISTIGEIIEDTCEKLWSCLQPLYMPEPDERTWSHTAKLFYKRTHFPHCLGAVDGKHIRCEKPNCAGSEFYNYKLYHSLVLMAVADANYYFISVDIGAYGSSSDSTVFKISALGKKLEGGQLLFPSPNCLPKDENGKKMPYVFVGDEAFALSEHIMRPYPRRNLSVTQGVFNYRLTLARRFVECTFGILTNKWRILHRAIDVKPTTCDQIIKACCILHNYVRKHDGIRFKDKLFGTELKSLRPIPVRSRISSIENRQYFAEYFDSSKGSISWQYEKM